MDRTLDLKDGCKIIITKIDSKLPFYRFRYYEFLNEKINESMSIKNISELIIALTIPGKHNNDNYCFTSKGKRMYLYNNDKGTTIKLDNNYIPLSRKQKDQLYDILISLL